MSTHDPLLAVFLIVGFLSALYTILGIVTGIVEHFTQEHKEWRL